MRNEVGVLVLAAIMLAVILSVAPSLTTTANQIGTEIYGFQYTGTPNVPDEISARRR